MDIVDSHGKNKRGDSELDVKRNLINGFFFGTGIYPLNRNKVLDKIPDFQYNPGEEVTIV